MAFPGRSKDVGTAIDQVLLEERLDEHGLVVDDMKVFVKEAIIEVLTDKEFDMDLISEWTDQILQRSIQKLHTLEKSYKFIVVCTIVEKLGDLHSASVTTWDNDTDDHTYVKYENETLTCMCYVAGIKI